MSLSTYAKEFLESQYPDYSWCHGDYLIVDYDSSAEMDTYLRKKNIIEDLDWKWYWAENDIESNSIVIGFKEPNQDILAELKLRFSK